MEGKTLVEKIANAPREGHVPDGEPVETPDDVKGLVDPVTGEASEHAKNPKPDQPDTGGPGADTNETDAIVRAAKARRGGGEKPTSAALVCLVVDDSRVIRKVSTKIAKSLGYVAIEAQDGGEALAQCKRAMPDLVLTDWNMPEMDGLEFVRALRAIPTAKPPTVVFCTSKGEAADIHEGITAGADDYIVKPFDEAALKAKLEKLGRG